LKESGKQNGRRYKNDRSSFAQSLVGGGELPRGNNGKKASKKEPHRKIGAVPVNDCGFVQRYFQILHCAGTLYMDKKSVCSVFYALQSCG
jgi:hypothetical protein